MMNKKIFLLILLPVFFSFLPQNKKKIKIFLAGDSTIAIKETNKYPETGWGMPFAYFWDSTVTVVNKAKNGRSTKTFINEGLWQSIMNEMSAGDYVFIQFGHNDEAKEKTDRYTSPEQYKNNLRKFIDEVRAKNGTAVLITPVSRRKFDKEGNVIETHKIYSALVEDIAKEKKIVLIDLDTQSRNLYQQFGDENSKLLFLQLNPDEHPNYPEGRNDNTHFSELGARKIAEIVLKNIKEKLPDLSSRIYHPEIKKQ